MAAAGGGADVVALLLPADDVHVLGRGDVVVGRQGRLATRRHGLELDDEVLGLAGGGVAPAHVDPLPVRQLPLTVGVTTDDRAAAGRMGDVHEVWTTPYR